MLISWCPICLSLISCSSGAIELITPHPYGIPKSKSIIVLYDKHEREALLISLLHLSLHPAFPPCYCQRKQSALRGSLGFWVKVTQTGDIYHMERRCPRYCLTSTYTFKDLKIKKNGYETKILTLARHR